MKDKIRQLARRYLPESIRKPLGTAAGKFEQAIIQPIQGLIFDLSGGRFRVDGCEFIIPTDITSRSYRACFLNDSYEAEERELIRDYIRPTDVVLELGACLGIVSCVTNKILADKSRHVVVEGNPFCIPAIHRNRELNHAGFLVENAAASNERDVTFYLDPVYVVGSSTTQRKTSRPVRVPTRSLAELESRQGPFNTLIIDIEGSELEIFSASTEILKRYRLVIVELHPRALGEANVERCREILAAAGLQFQRRVAAADASVEAWQRN